MAHPQQMLARAPFGTRAFCYIGRGSRAHRGSAIRIVRVGCRLPGGAWGQAGEPYELWTGLALCANRGQVCCASHNVCARAIRVLSLIHILAVGERLVEVILIAIEKVGCGVLVKRAHVHVQRKRVKDIVVVEEGNVVARACMNARIGVCLLYTSRCV